MEREGCLVALKSIITVSTDARKRLQKVSYETEKLFKKALKQAGMLVLRDAIINVNQKLRKNSKGTLGNSLTVVEKGLEVYVGPTVIYGRIHEMGGTIVPKKAKALAIPLDSGGALPDSFASPRDRSDLHIQIMNGKAFLCEPDGKPVFILLRSVKIPKRPYLAPALEKNQARIVKTFEKIVSDALEKP